MISLFEHVAGMFERQLRTLPSVHADQGNDEVWVKDGPRHRQSCRRRGGPFEAQVENDRVENDKKQGKGKVSSGLSLLRSKRESLR